jgi:hypothetical protein
MSTMMICPVCKGLKLPPGASAGSAAGRRCTCATRAGGASDPLAADVSMSSSGAGGAGGGTAVAVKKVCSVCGVDVTDKKRMKDGTTGRYWCYECFLVEQRKKQPSGMTMRCPQCKKDYAPVHMVKHGEAYWCETCDAEQSSKKKKKPAAAASPAGSMAGSPAITLGGRQPATAESPAASKGMLIAAAIAVVLAAVLYFVVL